MELHRGALLIDALKANPKCLAKESGYRRLPTSGGATKIHPRGNGNKRKGESHETETNDNRNPGHVGLHVLQHKRLRATAKHLQAGYLPLRTTR
jgi:hypothetical protein